MKIKLSTIAVFSLFIIVVGCIAYIILYNNKHIVFLNQHELSIFLINDKDNYHKSFHKKDLTVRNISSINEYNEKIQHSVCDFSLYQKEKVMFCVDKLNNTLVNINEPWFNGKKAIQTPWKFGSIRGSEYENGLPHTRGDVIILPQIALDNYNYSELTKLILHEKIHIYQKMYPRDVENYIQHNHFYKFKKRSEFMDSRANPDLNEWIYNDSSNKTFVAVYNSNATNISDVTFYPNNNNNEEHPFEKMAYEMSETIMRD